MIIRSINRSNWQSPGSVEAASFINLSSIDYLVRHALEPLTSAPDVVVSIGWPLTTFTLPSLIIHIQVMPASPKLKASSLPTVNMVRRSSAHIARRFFFGRRGLRRTLILFLALLFIYYLSRGDDNPYNLKKDEDVVDKYPDRDSKATAFRALQEKKQKISPVSRLEPSKDGLIRVGNWVDRRHPLLEIIDRAEREWKKEVDFRPSTVRFAIAGYCRKANLNRFYLVIRGS